MSKIIAVIGATGAQGVPVVKHLVAPANDDSPSPWKVRALTRNTSHRRAKEIEAMGAELVQGSFLDYDAVDKLFEGAYGAFVNTDSFTVGAALETHHAFIIWEIALKHKLRHFVWSNLDYSLRLGNYNPMYSVDHHDAKARFGEFMMAQPNQIDVENGTMWTSFTTGPYMDMLFGLFTPETRPDGTRVFISPIGDQGRIPLIALEDLGWWVRYIFDNVPHTTGRDFAIASHHATFYDMAESFTRATGLPAEVKEITFDEYFALWNGKEVPVAAAVPDGKTWESNFRAWYSMWRDNIVKRDMDAIKAVHPPTSLEKWMRDNSYDGIHPYALLKNAEDHKGNLKRLIEGVWYPVGF